MRKRQEDLVVKCILGIEKSVVRIRFLTLETFNK
jgi:hypothetical protein